MRCLSCGRVTKVVDSREKRDGLRHRSRACAFGHRSSTVEVWSDRPVDKKGKALLDALLDYIPRGQAPTP